MHKTLLIFFALLATHNSLTAQYLKYEWEEDRERYDLGDAFSDEALIYLKYHRQYEYIYEGEERNLFLYQTEHEIMRANNDNALARSNRIYIPMRNAIELVELHARTINKDGTVIEFDKSEIKELEDEETGSGYKIFAIEGAEVGSEIEYYYTKKLDADYFGREFYQFSEPIIKGSFVLLTPSNLQFSFKSYNRLPEIKIDTVESTTVYTMVCENIPALREEEFSSYDGSRQRLEFKLGYNEATGRKLFQWSDATQLLYGRAFLLEKEESKALEKLLGDVKLKGLKTIPEKVAAIEDFIKTSYYLNENAPYEASSIPFILENRIGSKLGLTKLTLNAFKLVGANPSLVLTSDRSEVPFDGEFESYNYLQDYLIYLPEDDSFVAPYNPEFRYGMVPAPFTATEGLFISQVTEDGMAFPKYEIKKIPALPAADNLDKMDVNVTFNEDLTANTVHLKRSFNGYQAAFIKAVYPLIEEARKEELLKSLVKFLAADANITTLELKDKEFHYETWEDPLVIDSEFESPSFIELAGDIILLKVGEMIGPQTEMYQENERMTEVENDFNREYQRNITITLPEGYKVENLDDLNFDEKVIEDGETIFYFKSGYELKGQKLKIYVNEAYEEIYYPKEKFEAFRTVINAAADWNKIVLVMSK
ncbi:MAG: DUF3857 domain-containing protein [Fulvivirga sp.]|uniref:DUF3857 domain-containing protein n=1 Tax=Fulvivirga sp. TaxID=1931237 RepID=UPI0032ECD0CC